MKNLHTLLVVAAADDVGWEEGPAVAGTDVVSISEVDSRRVV